MRPLSLSERLPQATLSLSALLTGMRAPVDGATTFGVADYTDEVLASSLPGLRSLSGRALRSQLDGYVEHILDRDIPDGAVRVYAAQSEARVKDLRTARGRQEVDLIVERADGSVVAIEVKLARDVSDGDVRHLKWLKTKLGDQVLDQVVLTTGPTAYRREDGVAVVPATLLGP